MACVLSAGNLDQFIASEALMAGVSAEESIVSHWTANCVKCMQVDVVEAQCAVLQEHIGKARDFEDAESSHSAFLSALLDKTMLSSPRVAKALKTIYQLCTRLCSLVQVLFPLSQALCLSCSV